VRTDGDAVALDTAAEEVDVAAVERGLAEGTPVALARAWREREGSRSGCWGELALEGLAKLLTQRRNAGQGEAAIQTGLLALDPLQEPAHRALMRLYTRAWRRGAALRQYQQCVEILQRELGIEPVREPSPTGPNRVQQSLLQVPIF
jgi:Bacterial transcriptional activator domain